MKRSNRDETRGDGERRKYRSERVCVCGERQIVRATETEASIADHVAMRNRDREDEKKRWRDGWLETERQRQRTQAVLETLAPQQRERARQIEQSRRHDSRGNTLDQTNAHQPLKEKKKRTGC